MKRKLKSKLIITILLFATLAFLINPQPVKAVSGNFMEDFTTIDYMDPTSTTVSGWGSGAINLPRKSPTLIGSCDTLGSAYGVFISGDHAYVADGSSGLQVINITNSKNPTSVGFYDSVGYARDVFVSGDYAYVADGSFGLLVVNITTPSNPIFAGSYDTSGSAYGVDISGDYAFVADGGSGLQVINIMDPTNPSLMSSFDTPDSAYKVVVSGDYVYVADGSTGLQVINVMDPMNPTLAGSIDSTGSTNDLFVSGDYAYLADGTSGIQVINITNPKNPIFAGSCDTPGYLYDVFVSGDYAYLADGNSGLLVVNITNPTNPMLVGSYDTPGYAYGVFVSGNEVYLADEGSGLQIIKISDIVTPTLGARYDPLSDLSGIDVSGDYAYITAQLGLLVMNIKDPANPFLAGNYSTSIFARNVFVSGNFAYLAGSGAGLLVVNITDPTNPLFASLLGTPSQVFDVYVSGDYAYLATNSELVVVNVTDPTNPAIVSSYYPNQQMVSVFVSGNYAYIAAGMYGFLVVNITDPMNPNLAGSYNTPGSGAGVYVSGDYAYFGDNQGGLIIFDISDPTTPTFLSVYNTPDESHHVFVSGDYAYVPDENTGLLIVNITDPKNPTYAGSYDTGRTFDVCVSGDYAYVPDYFNGFYALRVRKNLCKEFKSQAIAQSLPIFTGSQVSLGSATVTCTNSRPSGTSIKYYLSPDNGTHWEQVSLGVSHNFINSGSELKWKAVLTTSNPDNTPLISDLSISYVTALPAPTLTSPSDGSGNGDGIPTFEWVSVPGAVNYLIQIDVWPSFNSAYKVEEISNTTDYTPSSPLFVGSTNDREWFWRVAAYDSEGDLGVFSDIRSIFIDGTDPILDSPGDVFYEEVSTGHNITWNPSDTSPSSCTIRRDGIVIINGSWNGYPITINVDLLPVGTYIYNCTVFDIHNHNASDLVSVIVTATPPETTNPTIDHPEDINYEEGTTGYEITWNPYDENPSSYEISRNGTVVVSGAWSGEPITINVDLLPVGTYIYNCTVIDVYGYTNNDTVSVIVTLPLDTTNPTIDHPEDFSYEEGSIGHNITWNPSDENPAFCTVMRDDIVIFNCSWNGNSIIINVDLLPVGTYTYNCTVYDSYGYITTDIVIITVTAGPVGMDDGDVIFISLLAGGIGVALGAIVVTAIVFFKKRKG